MLQLSAMLQIT